MIWGRLWLVASIAGVFSLCGCTGGDMGNTRGGGAAPGQSGGRDTAGAAAGAASSTPSSAAPAAGATDTSKQGKTPGAKRP
jgi:hypothetical protein